MKFWNTKHKFEMKQFPNWAKYCFIYVVSFSLASKHQNIFRLSKNSECHVQITSCQLANWVLHFFLWPRSFPQTFLKNGIFLHKLFFTSSLTQKFCYFSQLIGENIKKELKGCSIWKLFRLKFMFHISKFHSWVLK